MEGLTKMDFDFKKVCRTLSNSKGQLALLRAAAHLRPAACMLAWHAEGKESYDVRHQKGSQNPKGFLKDSQLYKRPFIWQNEHYENLIQEQKSPTSGGLLMPRVQLVDCSGDHAGFLRKTEFSKHE